ncbi:MAG: M6 family metalloprotease domain-containing protein, partial [Paludibacteraceae bacterium]|nr:M6 family metalloprotease domain-containing protein [Paludibacteraceae bacterium]
LRIRHLDRMRKVVVPAHPQRGLVILVNFSDRKFVDASTANERFGDMLNQPLYSANGATGSAHDYFYDASMGQYEPTFDVYGPYTLPQRMSYYGQDYMTEGNDRNAVQMIVEACSLAARDGVDFSRYDADDDGLIDFVFVYYAGYNQAEGAPSYTIWPHQYEVRDTASFHGGYMNLTSDDYSNYQCTADSITFSGKKLRKYACTSELTGTYGEVMAGIGTFCHEFSHVLGLPDLYATNGATHKTMGYWDIMDVGSYNNEGRTPPTYSAYERMFMGWLTPTVLNEPQHVTLGNLATHNTACLITQSGSHNLDGANPSPTLFYLLENRQKYRWDTYLPGRGLLITKVNYRPSAWDSNTVNNTLSRMGVDLMEAERSTHGASGGTALVYDDDYYGSPSDAFPTAHVNSFTPYPEYPVRCIQNRKGQVSFDFMMPDAPCDSSVDDCFVESFDQLVSSSFTSLQASSDLSAPNLSDRALLLETGADNEGWTGSALRAANGSIMLGDSLTDSGVLNTPSLSFQGDIDLLISLKAANLSAASRAASLLVETPSNMVCSTTRLAADAGEYLSCLVRISGCEPGNQITLRSTSAVLIDYVSICPQYAAATDLCITDQIVCRVQDGSLELSQPGVKMNVAIYDLMGRMVYRSEVYETCRVTLEHGVYVVRINQQTLKIIL